MPNILDAVRSLFFERLQNQTNWGRNQIQALYTECERDIVVQELYGDIAMKEALVAIRAEKKQQPRGIYNPGNTQDLRVVPDTNFNDPNEDSPFHDDEDINKASL